MKIIIRAFNPASDSGLLFATWRKSVWFDTHSKEDEFNPIFFRRKTKEIKTIVNSPNINIKIACLSEDPDQIVGYAVLLDSTLEFVYVKIDYRKQGIASLLTKGFKDIAKPSTKIGRAIAENHGLKHKENKEDGSGEENKSQENQA